MEILNAPLGQTVPFYSPEALNEVWSEDQNGRASSTIAPAQSDTVNISNEAMVMSQGASGDMLAAPMAAGISAMSLPLASDNTSFTSTTATTKLGNDNVTFNNTTGAVTWNGQALNLKGLWDPKTDNITVQADGAYINVYNKTTGKDYKLTFQGAQIKDADNATGLAAASRALDTAKSALYISTSSTNSNDDGGSGNDMIVNRMDSATITGGAGNDKIFNFAKTGVSIDSGAGTDSIYTVGLSNGSITTGGNSYVKIVGNMSGGTITLGAGDNTIDAAGVALDNVAIVDSVGSTSSSLTAKSVSGAAEIKLANSTSASVTTTTLDSNVTFGAGANTLNAGTVGAATIKSTGTDSFEFKTLNGTTIDSSEGTTGTAINITSSAKDATISLGKGENVVNAAGKTLTSVVITDEADAVTTIMAGSITGTDVKKSEITLAGGTGAGNNVVVSGAVKDADIDTGVGKGTVMAGSLTNTTVTMDEAGNLAQTIAVTGNVTNSKLSTGEGDDNVIINGNVSANSELNLSKGDDSALISGAVGSSKVDLGDGDNSLTIAKTANTLTYTGGTGKDDVSVGGTVTGSDFDLGAGTNSFYAANSKGVGTALTDVNITASGTDSTDTTSVYGGAYTIGTAADNAITLGDGANSISLSSVARGKGSTYNLDLTLGGVTGTNAQTMNIMGAVNAATYTSGAGNDDVNVYGAVANSSFDLGEGENTFIAQNAKGVGTALTNVDITASGTAATDKTTVVGGAYTVGTAANNTITLGDGENSVTLASIARGKGSTNNLDITLGDAAGTNAQNLKVTGAVNGAGVVAGDGDNTIALDKAVNNLTYTGGEGKEVFTIGGQVLNSTLDLGDGDNALTVAGLVNTLTFTGGKDKDDITIAGTATNSNFDLGDGTNALTAQNAKGANQALNNVNITASGTTDGDSTTIVAGAYTAGKTATNTITLGDGANSVSLSSIARAKASAYGLDLKLGAATGTNAQTMTILGAMGGATYTGGAAADDVKIGGAVTNSTFDLGTGENTFTAQNSKGVGMALTDVNITSSGATTNDKTTIIGGAYTSSAAGNTITLGGIGENSLTLASIARGKGSTLDLGLTLGGTGASTLQTMTILGAMNGATYTGGADKDDIKIGGAVTNAKFDLGAGENTLTAQNTKGVGTALTNVDITASGTAATDKTTIIGGAYTSSAAGNAITLGGGSDSVTLASIARAKGATADMTMDLGNSDGTNAQTLTVTGNVSGVNFTGGANADDVVVKGSVSDSKFDMGAGTNNFTAQNSNGVGTTLTNVGIVSDAGDTTITAGLYKAGATNSSIKLGDGANKVNLSSISGFDATTKATLTLGGSGATTAQALTVAGLVNGMDYIGSDAADTVTLQGAVSNSDIDLGKGADVLAALKEDKNGDMRGQTLTNVNIASTGTTASTVSYGMFKPGASGNTIKLSDGSSVNIVA